MTSVKITDLTAYTDAASTDVLPIVDVGADVTKKIAIGDIVKAVPQGTAALPGLAFDGDPNSGLFSAGADQVAISTNGTGRLFVDASGNVGVGTVSTSSFQSTSSTVLSLRDTATSNIASLKVLGGAGAGAIAEYGATNGIGFCGTSGAHDFTFYTNSNERARITSDGKLGLGTSSPSNILEVSSNDNSYIRSTTTTNGVSGVVGAYTSSFDVGTTSSHVMNFYTAGVNHATLDTSGRFGIGTASVGAQLDIASTQTYGLRINHATLPLQSFAVNGTQAFSIGANSGGGGSFYYGTGNVEAARITSSGQFLLGTSSARTNIDYAFGTTAAPFQVERADALPCAAIVSNYDSATVGAPAYFTLARTGSTAIGSTTIVADGNYLGEIDFSGSDGTDFTIAASIRGEVDGTPGANDMPGRLIFSTTADGASSPTERMRIHSNGDITIAKTAQDYTTAGAWIRSTGIINSAASGLDFWNAYNTAAGAYRFWVSSAGTINATSTTISAISDIRFKENITDIDRGLAEILALKPRKFDWKDGKGRDIKNDRGFIAQEFEMVFPDLIDEWKDPAPEGEEPYKSVRQDLIPILVKAIQEQQAMIIELQTKVAALEAS